MIYPILFHEGVYKYLHVINYENIKLGESPLSSVCAHRENEKEQAL